SAGNLRGPGRRGHPQEVLAHRRVGQLCRRVRRVPSRCPGPHCPGGGSGRHHRRGRRAQEGVPGPAHRRRHRGSHAAPPDGGGQRRRGREALPRDAAVRRRGRPAGGGLHRGAHRGGRRGHRRGDPLHAGPGPQDGGPGAHAGGNGGDLPGQADAVAAAAGGGSRLSGGGTGLHGAAAKPRLVTRCSPGEGTGLLHKDSLVRGAFILAAGSLLSRGLGAVYRLLLPMLVGGGQQGAYALGLYNYSYRIYSVALVLSTVGLPLAVSRLVSQRLAQDDGAGARRVFTAARGLLAAVGLVITLGLAAVAPGFARTVDPNALYPILAIAPAVFLVSLMSAYRGLFQGMQVMTPYAVSQVVEQIVRVATILAAAVLLLPWGIPAAMAGASFGAVTGAAAAFVYLWYTIRRHRAEFDRVLAAGQPAPPTPW